ncbi:MAG: effector-associated constant component EACC1 [Egibacteraceae bacterium]
MSEVYELVVEPGTDRFDPDDDRWRAQVGNFYAGLHSEVGGVRREWSEAPGTKGGFETVVLALGSAGAFAAAVEYFRAWLGRDRTRSIQITHTVDGREETFAIHGEAIDNAVLQALAAAIGSAVAGRDG